jgi:hypothetical protein
MAGQIGEQSQRNGGKVQENVDRALGGKHVQQLLCGVVAVIRTSCFEELHFPRGQAHVHSEIAPEGNNPASAAP